jgi:HAMP domain-containing protein
MEQRIFHGDITPHEIGRALIARFNRGNLIARQYGERDKVIVQVASHQFASSGGQTALTVNLEKVGDGVAIQIGKQAWLGVVASLGTTILSVWRSPFNLLNRLDDVAQDIENIQLTTDIWATIEEVARLKGANFELSERLRRLTCEYCYTANPVGESNCISCGAPLGLVQPTTCKNCGYVVRTQEVICPNCGKSLSRL